MKIKSVTVGTDFGQRTVQLAVPIDVHPMGDRPPPHFIPSLVEVLWKLMHEIAIQGPALAATLPKAEA